MYKKYILYLIISLLGNPLLAQYGGGVGDGHKKTKATHQGLEGTPQGTQALYEGGIGDGFHKVTVAASLNGAAVNIYDGGRGDGFSKKQFNNSLDGVDLETVYTGGIGDGFSKKQFNNSLDGTDLETVYTGGIGDGFSKITKGGSLSGVPIAVLYNGGLGDGQDKLQFAAGLNGIITSVFFSGGVGDGFSKVQVQALLSGTSIEALYDGGDGDGFAKAAYNGSLIVLPVQLLSFDALAKETYVLVKWETASELDNDYFTIERSQNGVLFNKLMIVPSKGNSQTRQVYAENDNDPFMGKSYYRLKWTDLTGKSEYSEVRSVLFESSANKDFLLFPNPNDGKMVFVQLDNIQANEAISITVSDMQGKKIYQSQKPSIASGRISINLPAALAKGKYAVTVLRNGERSTKILIVQ